MAHVLLHLAKFAKVKYVGGMEIAATVATLVALTFTGSAQATTVPAAKTGDFLAAAQAYWGRMLPGRHPSRAVDFQFVDGPFFAARDQDPSIVALAQVNGFHIWFNRAVWDAYSPDAPADLMNLCTFVTHEYGHLIGLGHNPHYAAVMLNVIPPVECGGSDASGNPYLAQTQALYTRKAAIVATLSRAKVRSHRRALSRSLAWVKSQIFALER